MIGIEELIDAFGPYTDALDDELGRFVTYYYPFGMVSLYPDGSIMLESRFIALGKDEIIPALQEFSECYERLRQISQNYMETKNAT